ncbi:MULTISPECIES: CPBP family intramembrane glutamic endopeptidase [unclassified Candidatus Cardinium]|uniref:CPBP family intramembrane glutamic endopeptidase n=1 Tax=unclassified Candidatus Cardinium TaxID=2641185 RepID=UPI001FB3E6D7|nr:MULTISPECIES: CPBP family intramembrane glutamic endopeptidase [unclassified Candidatus Cardinium]
MSSNIKLITLSFIGLYLAIRVSSMLMQLPDGCLLNIYTLDSVMLRAIMCCTALIYHLHLQTKEGKNDAIQRCAHKPGFSAIGSITIGTILLQLMMSFALLLLNSIKTALWGPSLQPIVHFSSRSDFLWRGFIEITCMAAILEELLFRGILERLLSKIKPIKLWITPISALLFSVMHANMSNNLFYFAMGCFLSHLYHQTQNIIYPILAHALHNLAALCLIYFSLEETVDLAINSLPIVMRSLLAMGMLLAVYGYLTHKLVSQKTK